MDLPAATSAEPVTYATSEVAGTSAARFKTGLSARCKSGQVRWHHSSLWRRRGGEEEGTSIIETSRRHYLQAAVVEAGSSWQKGGRGGEIDRDRYRDRHIRR